MGEAKRRKLAQVRQAEQGVAEQLRLPRSIWPLADAQVQAELEKDFSILAIDYSKPGFHDSKAFLAAEGRKPAFIDTYARYVEARQYGEQELVEAQRKIDAAAESVSKAVHADGRQGLCVVASSVLSRMLDEMGVWNYCGKATLTVSFPPGVSDGPRYFWAIDHGQFTAPHAIVVAPPYVVVDTTASAQPYDRPAMAKALPPLVLQRQFEPYKWKDDDIASPEFRIRLRESGATVQSYLEARNPQMLRMMQLLRGRCAPYPGGELRYVITGVGGYVEKLADLDENAFINGKSPSSLLNEQVLPRLK